jgi:hypothetical protein
MRRITPAAGAAIVLLAASMQTAVAQETPSDDHHDMAAGAASMEEMMGDSMMAGRHLKLTPGWPEQPGDRARADSLVRVARQALAQYADVEAAERDGYRMFAPKVKRQKIYHYSKRANAFKARWTFDVTRPSALLYRPEPGGELRLIGAMYTAPPDISLEDLNQRIPLSIAQWHQHTSLCLPPGIGRRDGGGDMGFGGRDPRFGPRGSIMTEAECRAAGGEFKKRMGGWMVHVNLFERPDQVWEHRH